MERLVSSRTVERCRGYPHQGARQEVRALMNRDLGKQRSVRIVARLIVEDAQESEVSDRLGCECYERGDREKTGYFIGLAAPSPEIGWITSASALNASDSVD
jgi:hypothetical protein